VITVTEQSDFRYCTAKRHFRYNRKRLCLCFITSLLYHFWKQWSIYLL